MTGESSRDLYGTWVSPGGGIWCCPTELRSSLLLSSPAMNFYRFCCCNLHYYLPGRSRTAGFCCRLSLLFLLMERMGNQRRTSHLSLCFKAKNVLYQNCPTLAHTHQGKQQLLVAFGQCADQSISWHINKVLIVLFRCVFPAKCRSNPDTALHPRLWGLGQTLKGL